MYSKNTIRRYILFQIPELVLTIIILFIIKYFYDYPSWIIVLVILLSLLKDAVLFRFTWKSYVVHKKEDYAGVKGKHGVAQGDFSKRGLVRVNGELWKVEVNRPVKKGDKLVITNVKGLLLIAEKVN
jgi:membrane protein implicated in regulation of membrane protease activity